MWASELFMLRTRSTTDLYVGWYTDTLLSRIEVVMFNCPERGIAAQSIRFFIPGEIGVDAFINETSCDSLVTTTLLVPNNINYSLATLQLVHMPDSQTVAIAEVRFYASGMCLQDQPSSPTTTSRTYSIVLEWWGTILVFTTSTLDQKPSDQIQIEPLDKVLFRCN